MNPAIPKLPCFNCKKLTDETQSIYGVGCMKCFKNELCKPVEKK